MDLLKEVSTDGNVQHTQLSRKLTINGITKPYPVYKIRLDQLRYNPQNDRIATWISQYEADHNGQLPDQENVKEYNDIIEDFIVQSNKDAINKTKKNIELMGQREPGVVLANGLIIDGNRRFTCLRQLAVDNPKFDWFEAAILDNEVAKDKKGIKELELSIQIGEESKVDYSPIERYVGIYKDVIKTGLLTPEEYSRCTQTPLREVEAMMKQAQLMIDFLDFINAPEQFYLARQLSIGSVLQEIPRILNYCEGDEDEMERVKNIIFANMVVEPEGDTVRFLRNFKKVLKSEAASDFLDREEELTEVVVDKLNESVDPETGEPKPVTKEFIANEIRADSMLVAQMKQCMETAVNQANGLEVLDKPLKQLRGACDLLDGISLNAMEHFSYTDLQTAVNILKDLEQKAETLVVYINGKLSKDEIQG